MFCFVLALFCFDLEFLLVLMSNAKRRIIVKLMTSAKPDFQVVEQRANKIYCGITVFYGGLVNFLVFFF